MHRLYVTRGSGNCFKPFLAAAQVRVPLQIVEIDVLQGEAKSPEYRAVNPAGVVPYLVTAQMERLGESNAMLWFLADGSDLIPTSALERACSLQWMFFEQTKLEPFISPARFLSFLAPSLGKGREAEIEQMRAKAREGLKRLDEHLSSNTFMVANRYGITDIAIFGYVQVADEAGIDLAQYSNVRAWINAVRNTQGFQSLDRLCAEAFSFRTLIGNGDL